VATGWSFDRRWRECLVSLVDAAQFPSAVSSVESCGIDQSIHRSLKSEIYECLVSRFVKPRCTIPFPSTELDQLRHALSQDYQIGVRRRLWIRFDVSERSLDVSRLCWIL